VDDKPGQDETRQLLCHNDVFLGGEDPNAIRVARCKVRRDKVRRTRKHDRKEVDRLAGQRKNRKEAEARMHSNFSRSHCRSKYSVAVVA
jgi:hypothetical protein